MHFHIAKTFHLYLPEGLAENYHIPMQIVDGFVLRTHSRGQVRLRQLIILLAKSCNKQELEACLRDTHPCLYHHQSEDFLAL